MSTLFHLKRSALISLINLNAALSFCAVQKPNAIAAEPAKKQATATASPAGWAEPTPANSEFFEREVRPISGHSLLFVSQRESQKEQG
jgi:hypothetical protein